MKVPDLNPQTSLICYDSDPDWLEKRKGFLTASSVAVLLGLDPYTSKKQYIKKRRESVAQERSRFLTLGSKFEEHNLSVFSEVTGLDMISHNGMYKTSKFPGLSCTTDGFLSCPAETDVNDLNLDLVAADEAFAKMQLGKLIAAPGSDYLLELKNTDSQKWFKKILGKNGKSYYDVYEKRSAFEPPIIYQLQVQVQMMVTGIQGALLLPKTGANSYGCFARFYDAKLHDMVLEALDIYNDIIAEEGV